MQRFFSLLNNLYLVGLIGLSVIAFIRPSRILCFDKAWIVWSLAASILGMGLTLSIEGFKRVAHVRGAVALLNTRDSLVAQSGPFLVDTTQPGNGV